MCFPECVGKEHVGTITAFEMWCGSLVLPECLHLREAGTAEVALEVVLPSFSRPIKGEDTMVVLEPRMFLLLVRVAALLCHESTVAVATLEHASVLEFPVLGEWVVE